MKIKPKQKLEAGVLRLRKLVHQSFSGSTKNKKQLFLIFGCQRSGTTMLTQLFRRDLDSYIYGERGLGVERSLRIRPLPEVREIVAANRATLQVCKLLVESQRADEILRFFPESRAIWLCRDYRDVAYSNYRRFGTSIAMKNLQAIIDESAEQTFASEQVSDETRKIVHSHLRGPLRPFDPHCLYWYARNVSFFDQELQRNEQIRVFRYEQFVSNPGYEMRKIYRFLNRDFPGNHIVENVRQSSIRKGANIDVSDSVITLCSGLQSRLEHAV